MMLKNRNYRENTPAGTAQKLEKSGLKYFILDILYYCKDKNIICKMYLDQFNIVYILQTGTFLLAPLQVSIIPLRSTGQNLCNRILIFGCCDGDSEENIPGYAHTASYSFLFVFDEENAARSQCSLLK